MPTNLICIARDGYTKKRIFQMEAWRYWEIVEELNWTGVSRKDAHAAANWAMHAKPKEVYETSDGKIIFEIVERRSR